MKFLRWFIAAGSLLALGLPLAASAHTLKTDNGMYGILHINPNDAPVAGESSELVFYLGSQNPARPFNLADCRCQVTVVEQGKTLLKAVPKPETPGSTGTGVLNFTFPKLDVYEVNLTAAATDGSFASFNLTYEVRVDQAAPVTKTDHTETIILIAGGLGLLGVLAWRFWPVNKQPVDAAGRR